MAQSLLELPTMQDVVKYGGLMPEQFYKRLIPLEARHGNDDQGDPCFLTPTQRQEKFKHYIYYTDDGPTSEKAISVIASDNLAGPYEWIGQTLLPAGDGFHWAPEVIEHPDGGYVMYYSRSETAADPNIGQHLRVAWAERPEGPFKDYGALEIPRTPDEPRFNIDPHFYRDASGQARLAYVREILNNRDIFGHERLGVGLATIALSQTLLRVDDDAQETLLAVPAYDFHMTMPNRTLLDRLMQHPEWANGVDWHCLEAPMLTTMPDGKRFWLYSGGNYTNSSYYVGAIEEHENGERTDLAREGHAVLTRMDGLVDMKSGESYFINSMGHPDVVMSDLLLVGGRYNGGRRFVSFAPLGYQNGRPAGLTPDEVEQELIAA